MLNFKDWLTNQTEEIIELQKNDSLNEHTKLQSTFWLRNLEIARAMYEGWESMQDATEND